MAQLTGAALDAAVERFVESIEQKAGPLAPRLVRTCGCSICNRFDGYEKHEADGERNGYRFNAGDFDQSRTRRFDGVELRGDASRMPHVCLGCWGALQPLLLTHFTIEIRSLFPQDAAAGADHAAA